MRIRPQVGFALVAAGGAALSYANARASRRDEARSEPDGAAAPAPASAPAQGAISMTAFYSMAAVFFAPPLLIGAALVLRKGSDPGSIPAAQRGYETLRDALSLPVRELVLLGTERSLRRTPANALDRELAEALMPPNDEIGRAATRRIAAMSQLGPGARPASFEALARPGEIGAAYIRNEAPARIVSTTALYDDLRRRAATTPEGVDVTMRRLGDGQTVDPEALYAAWNANPAAFDRAGEGTPERLLEHALRNMRDETTVRLRHPHGRHELTVSRAYRYTPVNVLLATKQLQRLPITDAGQQQLRARALASLGRSVQHASGADTPLPNPAEVGRAIADIELLLRLRTPAPATTPASTAAAAERLTW